jgi:hypothetical protein
VTRSRLQTSTSSTVLVEKTLLVTNETETADAFLGVERLRNASVTYVKKNDDSEPPYTVERALRTLESDTRESHAEACEALAEMFAAAPAVGVEIVMKGLVKSLTSAIAGGTSAFCAGGFALLHMFATAEVTSRRVKADDGVVSGQTNATVLASMRRYSKNQAVAQWGGMLLWALAKDNARCKIGTLNARVPGGRGTAAEILTNALRQHGGEGTRCISQIPILFSHTRLTLSFIISAEATAKSLCGAIMTFASNSQEWQEALGELGAQSVVTQTLAQHPALTFKGEFDALRGWLRGNN